MTKIKIFLFFFISLICVNCKKVKTDNLAYNINTEKKQSLNGTWYCNGFTKGNKTNPRYSIRFAEENTKYSCFLEKKNKIKRKYLELILIPKKKQLIFLR